MWANFSESILEDEELKRMYSIPKKASLEDFKHIIVYLFELKLKEEMNLEM
jgi:hypothetical protein